MTATQTRSIHELLVLLKNNIKVTNAFFGFKLKKRIQFGLCNEINLLLEDQGINISEYRILDDYLYENKPKRIIYDGIRRYFWEEGVWKPRKRWLNKHIKLTKS